jgi:hypothetical protein
MASKKNKNIESRLKRIEDSIQMIKEPAVIEIVHFSDTLPSERTENGITIRYVRFNDMKYKL